MPRRRVRWRRCPTGDTPWSFSKIADTSTAIPGGAGNFTGFGDPSFDGGSVAFSAIGSDLLLGIDLAAGGTIEEVVRQGIMLAGKTVGSLTVGREGLSDGSIAFSAFFTDGSQGIYVASVVPVPAALPLFGSALAMLGVAGWRRRRTV